MLAADSAQISAGRRSAPCARGSSTRSSVAQSLTDIFTSMKATHREIRVLVKLGDGEPESVNALVLARLQLEGLYTTCLLIEKPENVDRFTHEAWKRQYIRWLSTAGPHRTFRGSPAQTIRSTSGSW
jgi:hypothetical protein